MNTVESLRELLSERFPQADRPAAPGALPTGIPALDEKTGGLPRRALTELVCAVPSCGGQLFLGQLLRAVRERGGRVALIDGADEFDPDSWPAEMIDHLVWVRCGRRSPGSRVQSPEPERSALSARLSALDSTGAAMACADLFARNANLELVALDLRRAARTELRRISPTAWYRIQRAVEQTDLVLVVLTSFALVSSAQLRLQLDRPHRLSAQASERHVLVSSLSPIIARHRLAAATG